MKKLNDKIMAYDGAHVISYTVIDIAHEMGGSDKDINLYVCVGDSGHIELIAESNGNNWVVGRLDCDENYNEWKQLVEVCGRGAVEYAINQVMSHDKSLGAWLWNKYMEANEVKGARNEDT